MGETTLPPLKAPPPGGEDRHFNVLLCNIYCSGSYSPSITHTFLHCFSITLNQSPVPWNTLAIPPPRGVKIQKCHIPMWKKHQNLLSNNNDAPSITKHGSLVRPHAQIVALRAHCAKCAPFTHR